MPPFASITLITLIFFVVIPFIGAFTVRSKWRGFRRSFTGASLFPLLTYRMARSGHGSGEDPVYVRFFGSLEAIQHDRALSLRGGDLTVAADMAYSEIFIMPRDTGVLPEESPFRTNWNRLGSLTEGTRVFVAGQLHRRGSHVTIAGDSSSPLLVVIYDGAERDLLRRAIWSGRQVNEYWNQFTPASLASGTLALMILAYVLLGTPAYRPAAVASLTLGSVPLLPLLPPGVVLFFMYRRTWRRGRILRAHRDVLLLPLRHLRDGDEGRLPGGEPYAAVRCAQAEAMRYVEVGAYLPNPPARVTIGGYAVFGTPAASGVTMPPDPMTELTVIPGDATALSVHCQRLARRFEWLSIVVLGTGLLVNLAIVFLFLQYVVR